MPYGLHLGARLPAHATSTGRVLLASLDDEALEQWLRQHRDQLEQRAEALLAAAPRIGRPAVSSSPP